MAENIEIKARCADLRKAARIARRLGARLLGAERQRDTYFALPRGRAAVGARLKLRERTVHEGTLLGKAGERCLFQLHRKVSLVPSARWRVSENEWAQTTGLGAEATARCADAGVRVLGWQIARCGIRYESGGRFVAAQVFAEYHHPDARCQAVVSHMSDVRAGSYVAALRRLQK